MPVDVSQVPPRWAVVQERLSKSARRAGRSLADITVLAVTKNVPAGLVLEAHRCGARQVGENRVQEAAEKKEAVRAAGGPEDLTWHLIGHLQSNKVRKALEIFDGVQSLDGLDLAALLNREGEKRGKPVPCLVEVKVSEEPSKYGVPPESLDEVLDRLAPLRHVRVEGLMTIAPYFDSAEKTRPYFRRARRLFEKAEKRFQGPRPVLSMGMSADFEVAVEEGSTLIRVGTALFGERPATR